MLGATWGFDQMSMTVSAKMCIAFEHGYVMQSAEFRCNHISGYTTSNYRDFHFTLLTLLFADKLLFMMVIFHEEIDVSDLLNNPCFPPRLELRPKLAARLLGLWT